jgi:hypothetical protein
VKQESLQFLLEARSGRYNRSIIAEELAEAEKKVMQLGHKD